jgi:hypothetical protein
VRTDEAVDAGSHAPERLRQRKYLRTRPDAGIERPVAIAEAGGRAFQALQVARQRPEPDHDDQRHRRIEEDGEQPLERTMAGPGRGVFESQYAAVVRQALEHPGLPVRGVHERHFAALQPFHHVAAGYIAGLEEFQVHGGVAGQVGYEALPLRERQYAHLFRDEGQRRGLFGIVGPRAVGVVAGIDFPEPLLAPAHRRQSHDNQQVQLQEMARHAYQSSATNR